ncbi:Putative protein of unknown function [Podospora comata]|uniref:Uncharacterized protein n=1 Tax=Podospora comata TaxID=48703 RepID=A0ABY6SHS8_PODCO|nr:Putative protein of unknown function [Podospora comata]
MTFSRVPPQKPQRSGFLKREHKSNYLMESPISKPAPPCFPPACHPLISDQSDLNLPSQTFGSLKLTRKALPTSRTCFQQGGLPGSPHIGSGSRFSFQQGGPPGLVQRVSSSTSGAGAGVGSGTGLRFFQQGAPLHGWHRGSTSLSPHFSLLLTFPLARTGRRDCCHPRQRPPGHCRCRRPGCRGEEL